MTTAYLGTPGVISSVVLQYAFGHVVLIDRKKDTWERAPEGDGRYAVMVEPRRRYITTRSPSKAREEQARISALSRRDLEWELRDWKIGQ